MRIRSVKPEFWSHPITGRWRGELQAFAVSLLNAADDEGYFWADPARVRSDVRPFDEDSTIPRRLLAELSAQGWIEVRQHPSRGAIGLVRKFTDHQRIDRPKPSDIKPYFEKSTSESAALVVADESTIDRRRVDDESLLEGNREQGREQGAGSREQSAESAQEVVRKIWNDNRASEMPEWRKSKHRDKPSRERLKEHGEAALLSAVKRIAVSAFCRGLNDRKWVADPEFFLRPGSIAKVFEGKYDNPGGAPKPADPIKRDLATALGEVDTYTLSQLAELTWRRDGERFVGTHHDVFFAKYCAETYLAPLKNPRITIEVPS